MPDPGLVVVGASLAGVRAAEAARRAGYAGTVTVVDADPDEPYDRPPLSKKFLLNAEMASPPAILRAEAAARSDIELRLGLRATGLDPQARLLHLDGSSVPYHRLVIATGCGARRLDVPGAELPGVHYLRDLRDAHGLRSSLADAERVVVVGGGFIGMEVASTLLELGKQVTLVEVAPALLGVLGPDLSRWVEEAFRERGGILHLHAGVAAIDGADRVQGVTLSDGRQLAADLVVVGVGAVPHVNWLAGSGIELDNGIVCTSRLETNLPHVYAAGDVARWHSQRLGRHHRVEHWSNAVMQGIAAGTNASGCAEPVDFDEIPYFWSDFLGVRVQVAGHLTLWDGHDVAIEDADGAVHRYAASGRIVAIAARDAQRNFAKQRRLVGSLVEAI
ncbi:putative Ferredoxin--NAD(P)(+) reductase fdr [metagenome]|uniref:Putative Ferredoxin--NAD(P)(+) reductase fdr n=1 Tax=metagenome TaxID=256318 RepID=A0A2P2C429_9ZZZZ